MNEIKWRSIHEEVYFRNNEREFEGGCTTFTLGARHIAGWKWGAGVEDSVWYLWPFVDVWECVVVEGRNTGRN